MTVRYHYQNTQSPNKIALTQEQSAGHGDHWRILTNNLTEDVPNWLQQMIDRATLPKGLGGEVNTQPLSQSSASRLLLSEQQPCHINQVLAMQDGRPKQFINAYPCVDSPYGLECHIERQIINEHTLDAVLRLRSSDGSVIYAFDQLYTVNQTHYRQSVSYFVNFSAWAYEITRSQQDEVILVEDPEAIRYHRAFNDIVAQNAGEVPADIQARIAAWQPDTDTPLAPVEINLGHMCAYLFGDTLGQEDEAWCQGQVLGKQQQQFYGVELTCFDVVILREPAAKPFVVRIATPTTPQNQAIQVHDYIQANIWLQAAIYAENQSELTQS